MSKQIGIIGAGQLGRMMALAGYPLGLRFQFLDTSSDSPGGQVGPLIESTLDSADGLQRLADACELLTFDVENVPADLLEAINRRTPLRPPVLALATAQDRLYEKTMFVELGIPTPRHRAVDSEAELAAAAAELGFPCVVKTRRLGYDGRGQKLMRGAADVAAAWQAVGGVPLIVEEFIEFEREVSAIGVRSVHGDTRLYPLSHNVHRDGVLRHSIAPLDDPALHEAARRMMQLMLDRFEYAGVLTIEFFVRDGALVANEIAPRVHNSGHWTIEGAVTSQFENHLRAIAGLPLGDTAARGHSAMVNFLGTMPRLDAVLEIPGAHMHDYGKSPRPGRKLGHGTVVADTVQERDARLDELLALLD